MKKVKMYSITNLRPRDNAQAPLLEVHSKDIFKYALENCSDNLKGIEKIMKASKVIEKINDADEYLELEDAEFEVLKKSVNSCDFTGIVVLLHAPQILKAVTDAEG